MPSLHDKPKSFAVADPPYPGQSAKHCSDHEDFGGEVDHRDLLDRLLRDYDGWVLHTSAPALFYCQSLLAERGLHAMDQGTFRATGDYRIGIWAKPMCAFKKNVKVAWTWEPVLIKALRSAEPNRIPDPRRPGKCIVSRDHIEEPAILEPMTMRKGLTGVKPERVCHWLFEVAGLHPEDEFHDLYPGSGAVTRAHDSWCSLFEEKAA